VAACRQAQLAVAGQQLGHTYGRDLGMNLRAHMTQVAE
jgi:hypothetical protein